MAFGWFLIVFGLVHFYPLITHGREAFASRRWPCVGGRILGVDVHEERDYEGTFYRPYVRYEYVVAGKQYESERIGVYNLAWSPQGKARRKLRSFGNLESVPVFYDPQRPEKAVLKQGFTLDLIGFPLTGAAFVSFGIFLLLR